MPNAELLRRCTYVFAAEMVIDVIKHAVLGKFNEIRPGVYREFMKVGTLEAACCALLSAAVAAEGRLHLRAADQALQACNSLVSVNMCCDWCRWCSLEPAAREF